MPQTDYIPRGDAPFKEWARLLVAHLQAKATEFGLPIDRLEELIAAQNDFNTAFDVASNPETRTPAATLKKTEMRRRFEKTLRKFIAEFITNSSKVADWDRISMGLPVHKTHSTPRPKPETYPVVTRIDRRAPGYYTFHFRDVATEHTTAKPFGVQRMEFGYVITDGSKPVTYSDFTHSAFRTRSPLEIRFNPEAFGKKLSYATRWENSRGEMGPWSPVESLIIG
jgi:hypothetical protein